jgi:hypothetical protein
VDGHETKSQLDRYRQMVRTVKELDLGELVPLDEAVPELYESDGNSQGIAPGIREHEWRNGRRTGFRFPATGDDEGQPVGSAEDEPPQIARVTTAGHDSQALGHDSTEPVDVVEAALANALAKATAAERWDLVSQLAKELEARRLARSARNVVTLTERKPGWGQR